MRLGDPLFAPPDWVLARIRARKGGSEHQPTTVSTSPPTNREEKYAQAAVDGIAQEVAATGKGGRNNKLNAAAFRMGTMVARGWIGANTASGRLLDAAAANGLLADDGEHAVRGTIKSGIEAGMKSPHSDIPDRKREPGNDAKIIELAALRPLDYGRARKTVAKELGVSLTILDGAVKESKKESAEQHNFLPHWTVEPWPNPVDGDALLKDLRSYINRFIVLPEQADVALVLYAMHTYVFQCFDITPYLAITSPTRRCGKTLLMTMLFWLCCRAKKNDSMSKAAIYRSVERDKPTLVLDEVGWVVDQKDERQNILCGGFELNGNAEICVGEGADITTQLFSTYCPKVFGLIGKLTPTLMDRSVEIKMRRKMGERVERLRRRDNAEYAKFRSRFLRWAQDNAEALAAAVPALPEKLNDRAIDFWEPLFAVAAQVGGDWTALATEAALVLSNEDNTEQEERGVELLADIKTISDSGIREIATKDLIAALCTDEERPWATYNTGKPISDRQVAKLLKSFVVISETIYAPVGSGKKDAKGYKLDKFKDAFGRYLTPEKGGRKAPSSGVERLQASERQNADGSSTSSDFSIRQESDSDGCENDELAYSPSDSDAQTAKIVKPSRETSFGHSGNGKLTKEIPVSGEIEVASRYAISSNPEDRKPLQPGQLCCRVRIREIRHPAISAGPDDNLDDLKVF